MRNLLGRLLQRSPHELERIARFWGIELGSGDRHADVSHVYRTMTDIWAVRDTWERLSDDSKALVRALDEHDGIASLPAQLATESGLDPAKAISELRTLYEIGIVSTEDLKKGETKSPERAVFLPREMGLMIERVEAERTAPSPRALPLDELLAIAPYPEIEEAAGAWGARVIPALHARGELVGIVREQLAREDRVERMVASLSEPARNLWIRLKRTGGVAPIDELLSPTDVPLLIRRRILRELAAPLLVWHGYDDEGRRLAIIPSAILNPTPQEVEQPPDLTLVESADVLEAEWLFPYAAAWDLLTILRDVTTTRPRWKPLAEGDQAIVRRLRRKLWRTDRETMDLPTGYIPFIVRIGAMMGVLREDDDRALPGDAAGSWREHAFTSASQRMVAAWTNAEEWIEGRERVDAVLYGASWPAMRRGLIAALGELDEGQWYDQGRFIQRLLKTQPDLLRQAQLTASPGMRRNRPEPTADTQDRREQLLTLVIGTTLETAGVWLGLVDRSRTLAGRDPVLRLTPFGRWIAGKRVEPSTAPLGDTPIEVGGNFQVLLYRPTPRRVWALSAFAELQTLDRVSTYTLTAEALVRALAGGIDLDQITGLLEHQNGGPLPQNVAYTLAEWDRGYRRVWLRRAVVLVPDEGEESRPIADALREAGLEPEVLQDGRIALLYDEPDAGERLYTAAQRALRDRGFAPLADPQSSPTRKRSKG